jgi:hypothetical protein
MHKSAWRTLLTGSLFAATLFTGAALAHHGWDWAESGQVELTGTIREVYIGPPHPTLQVETDDGLWTVELGNPTQTANSGFVEGVAEVGDTIVALGNRSLDPNEQRMKAVRVEVGGETYDIYPDRIQGG